MSSYSEILLHDVKDHGELRENEDPVIVVFHLGQQIVENGKFAAVAYLVIAQTEMLDTLQIKDDFV